MGSRRVSVAWAAGNAGRSDFRVGEGAILRTWGGGRLPGGVLVSGSSESGAWGQ